jgi:hypothetical protein
MSSKDRLFYDWSVVLLISPIDTSEPSTSSSVDHLNLQSVLCNCKECLSSVLPSYLFSIFFSSGQEIQFKCFHAFQIIEGCVVRSIRCCRYSSGCLCRERNGDEVVEQIFQLLDVSAGTANCWGAGLRRHPGWYASARCPKRSAQLQVLRSVAGLRVSSNGPFAVPSFLFFLSDYLIIYKKSRLLP